jgi:hypothetical protein
MNYFFEQIASKVSADAPRCDRAANRVAVDGAETDYCTIIVERIPSILWKG